MSRTKIGTVEAILIIMSVVFGHCVLSLPKNLVTNTKSSIIINLIYITIIVCLLGLLIYKLLKRFDSADIVDISEYLGGKILKNIIGTFFMFYLVISSGILLRNFCEGLGLVYFQMTDTIFIGIMFCIGICICNNLGFNASLKSNMIVLPIALASIVFIFFANFKNFDAQKIFPILGNGFSNTFLLGLSNIAAFEGIIYLYFLPPYLKEPKKLKKITLISILFTGIFLILCVSVILFIFPAFFTTNEIMPLYTSARYISFGTFLQRLDSIIMLIWIIAFLGYLCIACKFAVSIFQKLTKINDTKPIINIFGFLILGIAALPKRFAISYYIENFLYKFFSIGIVFVLGIGILVIANIKMNSKNKKVGDLK